MKKIKLTLLSLAALCLVGCGHTETSSVAPSVPASESEQVISNKPISSEKEDSVSSSKEDAGKDSGSDKADSSVDSSVVAPDSQVDSTVPDSSVSDSSSSSSHDYTASQWSHDVQDAMIQYLNGNILPYVQLASNSRYVYAEYDSSTSKLVISGDEYASSFVTAGKQAFDAAGWDTTGSTSSVCKAALVSEGLTVEIKEGTGTYDGLICIYAKWNEPFDSTLFTAWPQEILDLFNDNVNGNVLPLIYLGTKNPTGEMSSYSKKITITGGTWDNQVIVLAGSVLATDGWTTLSSTTTTLTAEKQMPDDWKLTVSIDKTYSGKAELVLSWSEPFVVPANGDWSADTKQAFIDDLDGHEIPYVYLGTTSETTYFYSSSKELDIRGDSDGWNTQILDLAETAFTNDGWLNITKGTDKLTCNKQFADGCQLDVTVRQYSNRPYIEIKLSKPYVVPVGGDWSADTKQAFVDNIGGHEIPYIYIGTDTATWNSSSTVPYLQIDGDCTWDDAILTNAQSVLTADGWTVTTEAEASYSYSDIIKGVKEFTDGTVTVEVFKYGYSSSTPRIRVYYSTPYAAPAGVTDWDQDVKDQFDLHVGGYTIPFVYLNTSTVTTYYYTSYKELDLKGGAWDDAMIPAAEAAFTAAGWTGSTQTNSHGTTGSYSAQMYTATITQPNGDTIKADLYGNYSGQALLELYFTEGFNPSSSTAWTQDILDAMNTNLGYELPFVYLGATAPTVSWSSTSYYSCLTLTGNTWDDSIFTEAETAYPESDGWLQQMNTSSSQHLYLTKIMPDTSMIYIDVLKSSNKPVMKIYYSAAYTLPTPTATDVWSASLTADFTTYLGGYDVPYFYMGAGSFSTSYDSSAGHIVYKSATKDWHDQYVLNARDVLLADGYTCEFADSLKDSSLELVATKVVDGGAGTIVVDVHQNSSSDTPEVYFSYKTTYNKPADGTVTWSTTIADAIEAKFPGLNLPYIYLGCDADSVVQGYAYTNELDLKGGTWNDKIYQDMADSLAADANHDWTTSMDYSSTTYKMVGSTVLDDGRVVTLKLYKSSDRPLLEIYVR